MYGSAFYERATDGSVRSAELVLPGLIARFRPTSAVDVGCGVGAWLSVVRRQGDIKVTGVDGPWVSRDELLIDEGDFVECDLARADPKLDRRFDLCLSTEVAEHLPHERSGAFVDLLCRLADVVVFSGAVPGQGGVGHGNEQWQSFWAGHFRRNGFGVLDLVRPVVWDDDGVQAWYRQNLLVYVRGASDDVVMLDVVHPYFRDRDLADTSPGVLKRGRRMIRSLRDNLSARRSGPRP